MLANLLYEWQAEKVNRCILQAHLPIFRFDDTDRIEAGGRQTDPID